MILRMRKEGIRHVPMLICSYCIKEIKASDLASIAYDLEGEGEKRVYSLHNRCIDDFERQTKIEALGTVPLECFPIYFMNVMDIDFRKASDHAEALSTI
jgi:hypothetical protein